MSTFLDNIRAFVKEHVIGHELDDLALSPPLPMFQKMHEHKLLHWWIPQQYGGQGLSIEECVDVMAEVAYADPGLGAAFAPTMLSSIQVQLWGSDAQKERVLRPMAERGAFTAMMGSEEKAGSELLKTEVAAVKDGDGYVLNGDKFFAGNADHAQFWLVLAAAKDAPAFKTFIVPRATPGAIVVKKWGTIGMRGTAIYQTRFENCRVPMDTLLPVHGLRALESALNPSRTFMAAAGVGICRRMRDTCMAYAKTKVLKGAPLVDNSVFVAKIGQMEMEIEAMYQVCKAAAREIDTLIATEEGRKQMLKGGTIKQAIVAKMLCGQIGYNLVSEGSKMLGGLGYTDESIIGKLVRDMRLISIVEAGDDPLRELMFYRYVKRS